MKIILINHSVTPLTAAIAARLREQGHQAVIAAAVDSRAGVSGPGIDLRIGNRVDRAVHHALGWLSDTHGMHSTRVTASLLDRIIALNPDVVHLTMSNEDFLNLPFMAYVMMRCKIPAAVTITEESIPGCHGKVLIRRNKFRRKTIESTFGAWDMLHLVCDSQLTAEHAALAGLDGHPTYIINPDDTAQAANQYITLYDNIK